MLFGKPFSSSYSEKCDINWIIITELLLKVLEFSIKQGLPLMPETHWDTWHANSAAYRE